VPENLNPQSIRSALDAISRSISAIQQTQFLGIHEIGGRALATTVCSPANIPASPLSAMDGYSFHSSMLNKISGNPDHLIQVSGKSLAGHGLQGQASTATAVRIFTGAVVPAEHDTVIPQELVALDELAQTIRFDAASIRAGANVRRRGEDLEKGAPALLAGTIIGPREIALLASMGIASVEVKRRIRVAIVSTGDEVIAPERPLPIGKTFDANRPMLLEMVRSLGAEAIDLGIVSDDADSLKQAIHHAATIADAVITSGGVSVGEADHTKTVMQSLGNISFWKLAIKPGRPLAAGTIKQRSVSAASDDTAVSAVPFFGLPGNPVAAFVTFKAIVEPCLQQLAGITPQARPPIRAKLARDTKKAPGRTEYLRCTLKRDANDEWVADISASQGAASIKSLVDADGLVVLPHDAGPLSAGTPVDVVVLR
jgi:molybdopterin molybdotransferase